MRRIMKIMAVVVLLVLVPQRGHAQFAVFDPIQTAQSAIDALSQLMETIDDAENFIEYKEKFESLKGWMNDSFGEGSAYAQITGLLKKGQRLYQMTQQLNAMLSMTELYAKQLTDLQQLGYNPYLITSFLNQLTMDVNSIKAIQTEFTDLLNEAGITKEKKVELAKETADEITRKALTSRNELCDKMLAMEEVRSILAATNFLDDVPAASGLDNVTAGDFDPTYTGSPSIPSVEGATYQDSSWQKETSEVSGMHQMTSTFVKIIMLLLGLLCVGSLCTGLVRYFNNTPGSERIFVRICVVSVVGIIVLSIISTAFGL